MDNFSPLVTVRTATPDEYERVVSLANEMYDAIELTNYVDSYEDKWKEDAVDWMGDASKRGVCEVAVAFDSATEQVVACGIGIIFEDIPQAWLPNGKMGYIRWMSTTEEFRGYGVGEQILNHLMNWFDENDIVRVQLHASDKAIEFYRQHGFEDSNYDNMWWSKP